MRIIILVVSPGTERKALSEISGSYLYKDILALDRIKKSDNMTRLLRALAFQIGSQVSFAEIGQLCGLDKKTVERYVTVLEQAFVVFRLGSYSRNLRNELKTSRCCQGDDAVVFEHSSTVPLCFAAVVPDFMR